MQIGFKVDEDLINEFEETLVKYHEVSGVRPVKQDSFETAIRDYISKLKKQIKILSEETPSE